MPYEFDIIGKADGVADKLAQLRERPFVLAEREGLAKAVDADGQAEVRERHVAEARTFYTPSKELVAAMNVAIAVGQPLILAGEPGTGKTQAAYYIAHKLKLGPVLELTVRSTSLARELVGSFRSIEYMGDAMRETVRERAEYFLPGPLLTAIRSKAPRVLLVDEIDKAPRDFPNDLLREFDQWSVTFEDLPGHPPEVASAEVRPIVVVTTNNERPLPDAFLRRCIYFTIVQTDSDVQRAVDARAFKLEPAVKSWALRVAQTLRARELPLQKRPALSEVLAWLGVLETMALAAPPADMPALEALIKVREDVEPARKAVAQYFEGTGAGRADLPRG